MLMHPDRVRLWPHLKSEGYEVKSVDTPDFRYNCIAFSVDEETLWWWPDGEGFWPDDAPREVTRRAFVIMYRNRGYEICADGSLEVGFEKIAIYERYGAVPTHAAKQLADGRWKSKLGEFEDIEHNTTNAVTEYVYGQVAVYMKRANAS